MHNTSKSFLRFFPIIFISLLLSSCEDVIDVDVPEDEIRLVIEASINWEIGTTGENQTIKLSTSTPYFETGTDTAVRDASVIVTNMDTGSIFTFTHTADGIYTTNSFIPILDNRYQLNILYNAETYTAEETLVSVAPITDITQTTEDGFDEELTEIKFFFTDPGDEENYYLAQFETEYDFLPVFQDLKDEFIDGNELFFFYERDIDFGSEDADEEDLQPGDIVSINIFGISRQYYDYIRLLLEQSESGNPFAATPAPLTGNCINTTNETAYPFGYFRLSEVSSADYTVQ